MLYVTARYGLFSYDPEEEVVSKVLSNRDTAGFFSLPSKGTFGMAYHEDSERLVLASREQRRFPWFGQQSHAKRLHWYDPESGDHQILDTLRGVEDVHQIDVNQDRVFVTDCEGNRVLVYDHGETNKVVKELHLGPRREDIYHVNTVMVDNGTLYVGLNKSPEGPSKVVSVSYDRIYHSGASEIDLLDVGSVRVNAGIKNTHDFVPYNGTYLISASEDEYVFRADTGEKVLEVENWTRGICVTDDSIWVGSSEKQKNSDKRERKSDGEIFRFDRNSHERQKRVVLPESGQVYDLLELE